MKYFKIQTLQTNYSWLWVHEGKAFVVDCGDDNPVLESLTALNLKLDTILLTHHHADHCGGVAKLKVATGAQVVANYLTAEILGGDLVDTVLLSEDPFGLLGASVKPFFTSGHTIDHTCYKLTSKAGEVFLGPEGQSFRVGFLAGDLLFNLGCGRAFEDVKRLWKSLQRLAELPESCVVFSGHDYGKNGFKFAQSVGWFKVLGENPSIEELQQPTNMRIERRYNPFLNCHRADFKAALHKAGCSDFEFFAYLRNLKDVF